MPAATAKRLLNAVRGGKRAWELQEGATEHQIVWRGGPAQLRAYPAQGETKSAPLLLITPIINRFRIVDLEPIGSLVGNLCAAGIPVFVADWGAPRRIDQGLDFEDYVLRFLPAMLDAVTARTGAQEVDVLGYCLGGTIATMFTARFPRRVRRLVTLNAPVAFVDRPHMDLMRRWVQPEHFPVDRLTRAFGNMPGALVAQGFLWGKPVDTALKLQRAWPRFDDPEFAARFWTLESWNADSVDIPGAVYRRLISELYVENRLVRGEFLLAGEPVDLSRIDCPLLVVSSARDTTCPPEAADALLDLVSSERREKLELKGGHVMGVVGPRAKATFHAQLGEWLCS